VNATGILVGGVIPALFLGLDHGSDEARSSGAQNLQTFKAEQLGGAWEWVKS